MTHEKDVAYSCKSFFEWVTENLESYLDARLSLLSVTEDANSSD